ncbi:MAG: CDP-glycerol glycerophosphotransferase family protein [Flavobacteriales bacterium]|nr:CDP-glycerol glycerophosphotransferase family protein [Flavobacteriales bacterium]
MDKTDNSSQYIVLRSLTNKEIEEIKQNNTTRSVLFYDKVLFETYSKYFNAELIEINEELKEIINREVMEALLKVPDLILNSTNLKDLVSKDFSIWHYQRFRAYFDVRNSLYLCRSIRLVESDSIVIFAGDSTTAQYFESSKHVKIIPPQKPSKKKNYSIVLKFLILTIIYWFSSFVKSNKMKKKKFLFLTSSSQYSNNGSNAQNRYFGKIISSPREDSGILIFLPFPKIKGKNTIKYTFSEFYKSAKMDTLASPFTLKNYLRKSTRTAIKKKSTELKDVYRSIELLPLGIEKYLLDRLRVNHHSSLIYYFQFLSFKHFFSSSRCEAISSIDENSPSIKSILDAAKSCGIKTIGIQHGSIHHLHPAYVYSKSDIQMNKLVDHMFVWGEQSANFLTEIGSFSSQQIHIIGQPRTDFISTDQVSSNSKLIDKYKNSSKPLIVFFSQPQRDENLRKRAAIDTFSLVLNRQTEHVLVKVHPNEETSYYEKIAQELGITEGYSIYKNEIDLYDLLILADAVITCFSTVGAEAAFFKKPLITLDYLQQDIQNYVNNKIAIRATNSDELSACIQTLLYESSITFNHDTFIREYAFKLDGKVATRFWQHLTHIVD